MPWWSLPLIGFAVLVAADLTARGLIALVGG